MLQEHENYKLWLDTICGLMVIDTEGIVTYMNEQCADYIKVDREKSIGCYIKEVFPPSNMENLLSGNKVFNTDFYFHEGRMSISTQVQIRSEGKVVGVLEYDMIQDVNALDDLLDKYATTLKTEMAYYREQLRTFKNTKYSINNIIGSSKEICDLKHQIELAATSNSTVLICGETGTGKELVAHSIHNLSGRAFHNFIKVNSAGMTETLAESELFGYVEGAFTGAKKGGKKGKFELADKGTLFIDEINQMPLSLQAKILRALQEGEIDPVGCEKSVDVDVKIIAATNQDLLGLVKEGVFRQDLFYRLNVFPIKIPPLRERLSDLPELVEHIVSDLNGELGKQVVKVEDAVYNKLRNYDFPGNVRELRNMIEHAMNYTEGSVLKAEYFSWGWETGPVDLQSLSVFENPIEEIKKDAERKLIIEVLTRFAGNKSRAADYLKIQRPLLYQKMKRLGIPQEAPYEDRYVSP